MILCWYFIGIPWYSLDPGSGSGKSRGPGLPLKDFTKMIYTYQKHPKALDTSDPKISNVEN